MRMFLNHYLVEKKPKGQFSLCVNLKNYRIIEMSRHDFYIPDFSNKLHRKMLKGFLYHFTDRVVNGSQMWCRCVLVFLI